MYVVWIIVAAIVVAAIIFAAVKAKQRWLTVKSEGGTRAEQIDRLQAYLKAQDIKAKTVSVSGSVRQLKVLRKDEARARSLVESFNQEA
ncbi:hypothetical protein EBB07_06215 [Paenibacillaceae bacterium]|nr:hypothetical protein EBB07_06215 [Paenibacillaceae bacterium]